MSDNEPLLDWQELKTIWVNSVPTKKIHIQMSHLLDELKEKASQFEKDSIKSDLSMVKESWKRYKGSVSQKENDLVNKDLNMLKRLLHKFFKKK